MARGWVLLLILLWQAVRQIDFDAETLSLTFPEGWEAILLGALAVLYLLGFSREEVEDAAAQRP